MNKLIWTLCWLLETSENTMFIYQHFLKLFPQCYLLLPLLTFRANWALQSLLSLVFIIFLTWVLITNWAIPHNLALHYAVFCCSSIVSKYVNLICPSWQLSTFSRTKIVSSLYCTIYHSARSTEENSCWDDPPAEWSQPSKLLKIECWPCQLRVW